jgi:hypothetical protein
MTRIKQEFKKEDFSKTNFNNLIKSQIMIKDNNFNNKMNRNRKSN